MKQNKKYKKPEIGFTLIELLVVISIITFIASILLANFNSARIKGKNARWLADSAQIQKAYELYYDDHSSYPTATSQIPVDALRPYAGTIATAVTQYAGSYFALSPSGEAISDNQSACIRIHNGYFIAIGAVSPNSDTLNDNGIEPTYYEKMGGDFKIFNSGVPGTYTHCPNY